MYSVCVRHILLFQRAASLVAEDQLAVSRPIPSKQPRVVEQSRVVEKSRVVESTGSLLPKKGVSSDPIQRSKRMLEAAGCYGLTSDEPGNEKAGKNLNLLVCACLYCCVIYRTS